MDKLKFLFQVIARQTDVEQDPEILLDGLKSISLSGLTDYKSQDVSICAPHNYAFLRDCVETVTMVSIF